MESNYVVMGDTFRADVFVAASDSTQKPVVEVKYAGMDSAKLDKAMILPVDKSGKGKYSVPADAEGFFKWGGVVSIKDGEGKVKSYNFNSIYQVAKPQAIVSADKMNVFYIGVDNPVSISVPGVTPDQVKPRLRALPLA